MIDGLYANMNIMGPMTGALPSTQMDSKDKLDGATVSATMIRIP